MKFVSKSGNLCVILKCGIPMEKLTGRLAQPAVSVRFQNGLLSVESQEICDMLLQHPGFNRDFFICEDNRPDPFSTNRKSSEPEHDVLEVNYGHVEKNLNPRGVNFNAEQKKIIEDMIKREAMKIAPEIAKQMLEKMVSGAAQKAEAKTDLATETPKVSESEIGETLEPHQLKCEACGTIAKNKAGLSAHKRFCAQNKVSEA